MSTLASLGGDLSRLRHLNSLAVIRALRGAEPLTLTAVAEQTGLSRPSTKDVVDQLVALGWVVEVPPSAGGLGRPARRYRFRADGGHVAGVDIGVHTVRAAVADLDGNVLAETRQTVSRDTPVDDRLAATFRAVAGCLAAAGLGQDDLWSVSAGTTGVVDREGRVQISAGIRDWAGVDLTARLGELFSCTVHVENDARLAALAERERGAAQGVNDAVFLHAGRRTGAALIIGGAVHRGFGGAAGEVGLLPVTHWATAADYLHDCPVVPADVPKGDAARHTFDAAREGHPVAVAAVERYADDLALGTSAMVMTLDPELVVLGGGFSRAADVLLPLLRTRLEEVCLRMPELRGSALGEECVALGAVGRAVAHLDQEFFGTGPGSIAPPR
ncbi:ROK family transcriptional regulator [Actinacidiphila bryophytorum]|uniref:NBD/HSP70 family sugar kinase n=1 Tax=Actinacidiphila bryophytorum TaxID=1436133 RepID=A0A9W4GXI3_9ACTN|nr:ROK family transcriptional regulator [Actinacidiphila bryophytorum]MBM9439274.1 ROK family transcriptional regulator [Actinacidiphila bryophytorum]MBN6543038.1 ROK family transcriptional regulator [Actinacidiphila bryophytorum]CAG7619611.1 Putative NBD/HSP70 family sugar kinase [Actinacidiphila bryophytorum]